MKDTTLTQSNTQEKMEEMKGKARLFGKKVIDKTKLIYFTVASAFATGCVMMYSPIVSSASGITIAPGADSMTADGLMGEIIGILLTVMRYVGVAMVIYGVYEIVMSIQNNQPEAKTKGIIMALSGVVMIAMKTVLKSIGLIGG